MTDNLIITIGRQCGSGGKKIGEMLAEKMGVKCYDKELLSLAAKHSGLCQELFEKHDERPTSSFLYSLVMDSYSMGYTTSGYSDKMCIRDRDKTEASACFAFSRVSCMTVLCRSVRWKSVSIFLSLQ